MGYVHYTFDAPDFGQVDILKRDAAFLHCRGLKPLTLEVRQRIMKAYGYNPASFKNLATDPVRSKAIPLSYKMQILIPKLKEDQIEKVYRFVLDLLGPDEI